MKSNLPAVLYEDDWIIAFDKPAGLLTIPAKGKARSLTGFLNQDLIKRNIPYRLHPCHRLDRETSGVILYAKGKSAQKKMMAIFKQRGIKKSYIAFVQGKLAKQQGTIDRPLSGQSAFSHFKVLEQKHGFAVIEINPVTGRKNQIRLHFKGIGHPVVGESRFSFRKDFALRSKRTLLHAERISFIHPFTSKPVVISSKLPRDMKQFLSSHP